MRKRNFRTNRNFTRFTRKSRNLKESNYGWSISSDNAWDALDEFTEAYGAEYALDALARAMSTDELAENMEYICRMHNFSGSFLDGYEDEDEDYEDEDYEDEDYEDEDYEDYE